MRHYAAAWRQSTKLATSGRRLKYAFLTPNDPPCRVSTDQCLAIVSVIALGAASTLIVTVPANLFVLGPLRQRLLNASVLEFQAADQCSDPALAAKLRAEARLRLRKYMVKLERTASTVIELKAVGVMLIPWLSVATLLSTFVGREGARFWIWGIPLGILGAVMQIASARWMTRRRATKLEAGSTALAAGPHAPTDDWFGSHGFAISVAVVVFLLLAARRSEGQSSPQHS